MLKREYTQYCFGRELRPHSSHRDTAPNLHHLVATAVSDTNREWQMTSDN